MENEIQLQSVTNGRRIEADGAKCLAILFMAIIHCMETFEVDLSNGMGWLFNIISGGLLAAPVFMFCMGMGFAYSRRTSQKYLVTRGLKIFFLGYLLNFLREAAPLMYCRLVGDTEAATAALTAFAEVDIMQFAGLSMILTGLLQKTKNPPVYAVAVGICLSMVQTFLPCYESESLFPGALIALLFHTEIPYAEMAFPLFGWFLFPAVGYFFGTMQKKAEHPVRFLLKTGICCGVCGTVYFVLGKRIGFGMISDSALFYKMPLPDGVANACLVPALLLLMYGLLYAAPLPVKQTVTRISRQVNTIYFIHWIVIEWFVHLVLQYILGLSVGLGLSVLIGIFVLLVTLLLSFWYHDRCPIRKHSNA